jgi:hypothetical protein
VVFQRRIEGVVEACKQFVDLPATAAAADVQVRGDAAVAGA